jgi:hypothetical protein
LNPDSTLDVPKGIGLGIEVRQDILNKVTLKKKHYSSRSV